MFENMPHLEDFSAHKNELSGTIPPSLAKCRKMKEILLSSNGFTGEIASELFDHMPDLEKLIVFNNKLVGGIPVLGNCSKMIDLQLSTNAFTGEIPCALFENMPQLKKLKVQRNQLTGTIPVTLASCASLEEVALFNNKLTGSIPAGLSKCPNLKSLTLDDDVIAQSTEAIALLKAALPDLEVK